MELIFAVTLLVLASSIVSVLAQEAPPQKEFVVECIRPLGIRVTPSPDFRIIQTGCRGQDINVPLETPYDVSTDCLVVTATGTAVQIILEEADSTFNLVGGFQSRVFLVSCDFPGSKGYKDTFNRDIEAIKQPEGLDPTATSGVFKFTGVLMSIIDKASFTARQWAAHLAASAFIGQELYLTISHAQRDEGPAFIIPRECRVRPATGNFTTIWRHDSLKQECRVRPATGNFTTIWRHDSLKQRCLEVTGISRNPVRVFSDVSSATDVMSLQFYGFQFLGHEQEVITFECDVLLCGDVSSGTCGQEWSKVVLEKVCVTNKPPPLPRPGPTDPPGKGGLRRRRRQVSTLNQNHSNNGNNLNSSVVNNGNNRNNSTASSHRGDGIIDSDNNNINNNSKNNKNNNNNNSNGIRTGMPSTTPASVNTKTHSRSSSSRGGADGGSGGDRGLVQEETVRVEIRMLMPRAKLTHMGSVHPKAPRYSQTCSSDHTVKTTTLTQDLQWSS
ncbi:hypothetical protein EGW08_017762 [Elysia chlorotica]|uniref:ZP domain-containing protein n=1 Tax=Elysia chlorotica TaxID=188477 RepID=A0A3S0ZAI9_ELYCH|nr:hypothetical protein EGW08_017762 [Elysia chlorotica]